MSGPDSEPGASGAEEAAGRRTARRVLFGLLLLLHLFALSRPLLHHAAPVYEWRKGPLVYDTSPYAAVNAPRIFWPVAVLALDLYLGLIWLWRRRQRRRGRDPRRGGLNQAAVSLVALSLALGAGEVASRAVIAAGFPSQYRPDPELYWYNRPNLRDFVGPRDPVPKSTNSLGFRGTREAPVDKPAGRLRVFVVGDSSTFGLGVRDAQTYSQVLERTLSRRLGQEVEVINSGCPGHTSFQGLTLLQRHGLPRRPDLVIWAYNNDPCLDTAREKDRVAHDPRVVALQRLLYQSDLYLLLRRVVLDVAYGVRAEHYRKVYPSEQQGWVRRIPFDDYRRYLRRFVQLSREAGAEILFVRMPLNRPETERQPIYLTSFDDRYRDYLTRWCGQQGLPHVNFEERFNQPYDPDNFLPRHLFHPSVRGHQMIGEGLAEAIAERGLLR